VKTVKNKNRKSFRHDVYHFQMILHVGFWIHEFKKHEAQNAKALRNI